MLINGLCDIVFAHILICAHKHISICGLAGMGISAVLYMLLPWALDAQIAD